MTVRGVDVALFNVNGTVFAMEDACLHAGVSLGTGELRGKIVRCRAHGWRYDVTTGSTVDVPDCGVHVLPSEGRLTGQFGSDRLAMRFAILHPCGVVEVRTYYAPLTNWPIPPFRGGNGPQGSLSLSWRYRFGVKSAVSLWPSRPSTSARNRRRLLSAYNVNVARPPRGPSKNN